MSTAYRCPWQANTSTPEALNQKLNWDLSLQQPGPYMDSKVTLVRQRLWVCPLAQDRVWELLLRAAMEQYHLIELFRTFCPANRHGCILSVQNATGVTERLNF